METGVVKFFTVNDRGGFGFLILSSLEEIYFQRNDGGHVCAGREQPEIQTWQQVRQPKDGDWISFKRSCDRRGRLKAAPWCYHDEWNLALVEIARRPAYRLVIQGGHRCRGRQAPKVLWEGRYIPDLKRYLEGSFPEGVPLTTQYEGSQWRKCWFEKMAGDVWEQCDSPLLLSKDCCSAYFPSTETHGLLNLPAT